MIPAQNFLVPPLRVSWSPDTGYETSVIHSFSFTRYTSLSITWRTSVSEAPPHRASCSPVTEYNKLAVYSWNVCVVRTNTREQIKMLNLSFFFTYSTIFFSKKLLMFQTSHFTYRYDLTQFNYRCIVSLSDYILNLATLFQIISHQIFLKYKICIWFWNI